jgi:hypothetical protein
MLPDPFENFKSRLAWKLEVKKNQGRRGEFNPVLKRIAAGEDKEWPALRQLRAEQAP